VVRTQIQLTKKQTTSLKRIAQERHISMAEAIRQGVDLFLKNGIISPEERRKRAIAISGKFHSKHSDLSIHHDKYLADDYAK
jgi:hypothetical protein